MTTLETCLSIALLCWAVAGLCFAWNQWKESNVWVENEDEDDADYWKKG